MSYTNCGNKAKKAMKKNPWLIHKGTSYWEARHQKTVVDVKLRNGEKDTGRVFIFDWTWDELDSGQDIVKYRLSTKAVKEDAIADTIKQKEKEELFSYGEIGGEVPPNNFTDDKEEYNKNLLARPFDIKWDSNTAPILQRVEPTKYVFLGIHSTNMPHTQESLEKAKARTEDGKDKPPLTWLPGKVLEQVANVMLWATLKYDAHSWKKEPTSVEKRVASAIRHLNKWLQNVDYDAESNLHQFDHAICQLMMAKEYVNMGDVEDGRY